MQGRHLCWPPTFFLAGQWPPNVFNSRTATALVEVNWCPHFTWYGTFRKIGHRVRVRRCEEKMNYLYYWSIVN